MTASSPPTVKRAALAGLFLLSAATLAYEINLTRLFSVMQFYHFAFMIVSLALLGFGAAGSFLAVFPSFAAGVRSARLAGVGLGAAASMLGAYLLVNHLPFDSFSLAIDRRQAAILLLHLLALAAPFFFSGLATAVLLQADPGRAGRTYAANLTGSAAGCALAMAAPAYFGGVGMVTLCAFLAAAGGLAWLSRAAGEMRAQPDAAIGETTRNRAGDGAAPSATGDYRAVGGAAVNAAHGSRMTAALVLAGLLLLGGACLTDLGLRLAGRELPGMALAISPYKGVAYALQYPGAEVIEQRWNAFSRLQRVRSPGIRSLPGLSYRYSGAPPAQDGLFIDGDELSPALLPPYDPAFLDYLPLALAFHLRPGANVLALEPRGGLDVLLALELGARQVTAAEANPLIVTSAANVYQRRGVVAVPETGRSFLRRTPLSFDVIVVSLAANYHPVRSGAYSLGEEYRYTLEAFRQAYRRLEEDGLLAATRWLQDPPSEELRLFALALATVRGEGGDPARQMIALRGFNTLTVLICKRPFSAGEIEAARAFASQRAFDLAFAPGLRPEESNRYNRLPQDHYYGEFNALLAAPSAEAYYAAYPYEVRPPTDDRPFFNHFFKWSQAGQVWAELGKTWQPFGGAGYFVILALFAAASLLASLLILLPAAIVSRRERRAGQAARLGGAGGAALVYFGLLGAGFMLVEIPLMQRFILLLGQPAYAMSAILFTLLLFSGLGSLLSRRLPLRPMLAILALLALNTPALVGLLVESGLGWPAGLRLAATVAALGPLGVLMGVPFAGGLRALSLAGFPSALVTWAWAVNGATSVIASILAALLALSFGFNAVMTLGAFCYVAAFFVYLSIAPSTSKEENLGV